MYKLPSSAGIKKKPFLLVFDENRSENYSYINNMGKYICKYIQGEKPLVNSHCLHNGHIKLCGSAKTMLVGTLICSCASQENLILMM